MNNKKFLLPLIAGGLLMATGVTLAKPSGDDFFKKFDQNGDGSISVNEFNSNLDGSFKRIDSDGSGSFDKSEFKQHSQQRKAEYKQKKKASHAIKKQAKFAALDKNSDGFLTKGEFVAAAMEKVQLKASEKFDGLDGSNLDGKISQQEFMDSSCKKDQEKKSDRHSKTGHKAGKMFSKMDVDNNGYVSSKEYKQSRLTWFNKLDADSNGQVTRGELKQAHSDKRKK